MQCKAIGVINPSNPSAEGCLHWYYSDDDDDAGMFFFLLLSAHQCIHLCITAWLALLYSNSRNVVQMQYVLTQAHDSPWQHVT